MFRVLLLLLCAALPLDAAAARTLLVLGDSLAAEYGVPRGSGWVSLLEQRLAGSAPSYRVVNASISGETAAGGRARVGALLAEHRPALLILELGANDGLRGQPVAGIRDDLDAIIRAARRAQAAVLLVGMQLPPNYGIAYTQKFQAIFPELARRHRLRLVPFLMQGFGARRELFQPDGIHPTAEAQPLMLETVWRELRPLLK